MIKLVQSVTLLFLVGIGLSSCGGSQSDAAISHNDSIFAKLPFHETESPDSSLFIGHVVKDYETWKAAFDLAESVREKYGIHPRMVLQGFDDANLAMVFAQVKNVDVARDYVTSGSLRKNMEVAGVEGEMTFFWFKEQYSANTKSDRKCLVFMKFRVSDYEKWKDAFLEDYAENPAKNYDVLNVLRSVDDTNEVAMVFAADNPQFVSDMESNTSVRMKMLASGVISYPETFILRQQPI